VGKLLGDAGKARARLAVILGAELAEGNVALKNLDAGSQQVVPLASLIERIKSERAGA
ncbi:MAG: Anticodon binding domain, partial [Planctomycetota bacterium]